MGFGEAVKTCLSKYITISGRAQRSEYWWFTLFVILMQIPMQVGIGMESSIVMIIGAILYLAMIIPAFCAMVRRLHDKDKSGWWCLIGLVPIIGGLVLLYWFVTRGTEGENQYGPDPLA